MNSKKTFTEFISILLNHSKNQRVSSTMELILQGQYHSHTKSKDITHTQTHTHICINIYDEYRFRNPQQSISKPNLIIPKRSVYHNPAGFTPRMQG